MKIFNILPCLSRRCLGRLLLVALVAIVMTAGITINSLIRKADVMRQIETILARIERRANELSALEWEVLHKGALDDQLASKVELSRREMAAQFVKLDHLDARLPSMHEVRKCYAAYLQPLQQEFALLTSGQLKAASELDETKVDPAFDRLCTKMNEAEKEFHELAASTLRKVQAWIFIVSFAGAGTIGLLFWRFYQKQQIAAIATAEQRVLQQANEQLRIEIAERVEAQRKLEQTQGELIKASRHAGMQEVATGVLHNVGNVLNSVNVSAALLRESLRKSQVQNLVKATSLLRDHAADTAAFLSSDPKGRRLPGYLIKLGDHLVSEQETWQRELDDLGRNIEHIKEIVTMQQSYARLSGVTENLKAEELVEDALRMNEGALSRHGVQVVREFQNVPLVSVDKHKVLQILINLIRNAKYAADEAGNRDKQIRIAISQSANGGVEILVQDNGVGISPENLAKIFQHGFTTKKDGHGFGLHSSVNAAREMGGSLTVYSAGIGTGAAFTLDLPAVKTAELSTHEN